MQNRRYILIYLTTLFLTGNLFAQYAGFIPYKQNDKWIVLDTACKIISKEKYDTICLMQTAIARVKQNNKWGYINMYCTPLIPIMYDTIGNFDGYLSALVKLKGKWGYIDRSNKIIIPIIYDEFGSFHSVYQEAQVRKDDSVYYINRKGEWVDIKKTRNYGICGGAHTTSIRFNAKVIRSKDSLFGLISDGFCNGKKDTLLPCKYSKIIYKDVSPFAILLNKKYSLYNTTEEKMFVTDCDTMNFYSESGQTNWVVYRKNKITGIVHPFGREKVEINCKSLKIISGDFIYITDNENQSYYINSKGKKFIPKIN